MALSITSLVNSLFKKGQSVSSTDDTRQFFEEPYIGRPAVTLAQIWSESADVPSTAPGGIDGQTTGVVKRYIDAALTAVPGTSRSFHNPNLVNTIPFNFGDGSYNYGLKDSGGNAIAFGQGDWLWDCDTGTLTFYGTVPSNMPPTISCYTYVGETADAGGLGGGGGGSALILKSNDAYLSPSLISNIPIEYWAYNNQDETLWAKFTVPASYKAGKNIFVENFKLFVDSTDTTKNLQPVIDVYLFKNGTDPRSMVNADDTVTTGGLAVAVPAVANDMVGTFVQLTIAGAVDATAVAAGDLLVLGIRMNRVVPTDASYQGQINMIDNTLNLNFNG